MHGLRRKSLSQICCGFGVQLRVGGWPFFGRITGHSRFTYLQGLYVFSGFIHLCSFILDSVFVLFELKSTIKRGDIFRMRFDC